LRDVEGFVLAGGRSQRMGRDKALIEFRGQPLVGLALEKLRTVCRNPRIAGNRPDLVTFAPVVDDLHPGCGPLSGIEAALYATDCDLNVFLPVDVPLLPVEFVQWMLRRAAITEAPATIPTVLGYPQPLCAVYHQDLGPAIARALNRQEYKVMRVILEAAESLRRPVDLFSMEAVSPTQRAWPSSAPPHRWFQNLNAPADLEAVA
jgi:molybdopterin-guanine dinucleotide biosynthesis protein A